jgi:hypothetical protein
MLLAFTLLARPTAALADVVHDWNALMVSTLSGLNPFAQARLAAMTQLAVFEAVNAITRDHKTYSGTVAGVAGASADAAAVAAAHTVLRASVPAAAATLDAARAASLGALPDGPARQAGIAVGEAAGQAMLAARSHDGSSPPEFFLPASREPGTWQPTPGCPAAGGVLLHWGNVTPFALTSTKPFHSPPPPPLESRVYARDYLEVKLVGGVDSTKRTPHQADLARFYNVVLAVAVWNPVARHMSAARALSLQENARLLALLNMAISDALVAVMRTKYHYAFWRPETAIRDGDADGNRATRADATFVPLITTPCFPSYGSAHAAGSYAAREVLERFFGDDTVTLTLQHPAAPGIVLHYESLEEITDDIDDARVYGGLHFRFDPRGGPRQGRRIGQWVFRHQLRPQHD